jgi:predicted RNase H-like nuclease (RuvC/YqgF family)
MSLLADILKEIPLSSVLREKISTIEAENAALQTENAILKDDVRQLKAENHRLKNEVEELTNPLELDEAKTQLLAMLVEHPSLNLYEFLHLLEIERVHLQYHLQELLTQGYVAKRRGPSFPHLPTYLLTQKGRKYVLENHLA